ncbi:MAG: S46 family peptidase [Bacteroidota bacterium]
MKKLISFSLVISFIFGSISARADEGMWLPLLVKRLNYTDMQKMGCQLTPEEIYSINNSCLKDAVVQFGNGCTGEVISEQGLLLTNHHCGYSQIQDHSSSTSDYIKNGFWAMNKQEELQNDGLTASFLVRIEDVSQTILSQLNNKMTESERDAKVKEISAQLEKTAIEGTTYTSKIKPFFEGNEYYMFVYEVFKDIRLVGAPPYSIGKFGADTDNWMWPRHKGDFCLFRVYTDKNGKSAPYSADNIPMKPKHSLPISMGGIKEGDYAMIMGYPGSTDRYLSSWGVQIEQEIIGPAIVKIRTKKLDILKEDMNSSNDIFIKYASKYARISNYWKYYIGQTEQLKNNKVVDKKIAIEKEFSDWINADSKRKEKYGTTLADIESANMELKKFELFKQYFMEAIWNGPEIFGLSWKISNYYKASSDPKANKEALKKKITSDVEKYFKDYNLPTDIKTCEAMLAMYYESVDKTMHPIGLQKYAAKNRNNFAKITAILFKKSKLTNVDLAKELIENPALIMKEPAYILLESFRSDYLRVIDNLKPFEEKLNKGKREFVAGLREMQSNKTFYPDANFTMRLTYGQVKSYKPKDAVYYKYYTSLEGVMEKEIPNDWEFDVSPKLKELYNRKDYGIYAKNDTLLVNFITTNDITGGNSGSPVLNGKGELIGLAFDGNWEAMSGDINYEPKLQRTSCVDIRYVLFVIDKFAGAHNIIDELKIN